MDIAKLASVPTVEDDGTFVHFKDAAGNLMYEDANEPVPSKPLGATVSGSYSTHFRAAQRKQRERDMARGKSGKGRADVSLDEIDDRVHELEVACLRSWTFEADGKPFPITLANWKALLELQPQWREQVVEAMHAHDRFFGKS